MKNNLYKIACLIVTIFFLGIVVISIVKHKNIRNESTDNTQELDMQSELITSEYNENLKKIIPNGYNKYVNLADEDQWYYVYVNSEIPVNKIHNGIWQQISSNEWGIYSIMENHSLTEFETVIKDIFGKSFIEIHPQTRQEGYLGNVEGGFLSGVLQIDDTNYYMMAYYTIDGTGMGYITSERTKLNDGYKNLSQNAITMIYSEEELNEMEDHDEEGEIAENDPYITELMNGAKYSNMKARTDFKKMRLIFAASNYEFIDKIYLRKISDNTITYPSENEEHNDGEYVFVVDNVKKDDEFRFVVFASKDVGEIKACSVEYEESEIVKARQGDISNNKTDAPEYLEGTASDVINDNLESIEVIDSISE